jgi:hypothetical protein
MGIIIFQFKNTLRTRLNLPKMSATYDPTFWFPLKPLVDYLVAREKEYQQDEEWKEHPRIVEITTAGVDVCVFPMSTKQLNWSTLTPSQVLKHDVVYLRHTLEKMSHPELLLRFLQSKIPRGYIEASSVLVECSRGIHHEQAQYRGHLLNRFLVWVEPEFHELHFLPKYGVFEHLNISAAFQEKMFSLLTTYPHYWNVYYAWDADQPLKYVFHEHGEGVDSEVREWFHVETEYAQLVERAVNATLRAVNQFLTRVNEFNARGTKGKEECSSTLIY